MNFYQSASSKQVLPLGLSWRLALCRELLFYLRTCSNSMEVISARRASSPLEKISLKNGLEIELVGNPRFCLAIFREVWNHQTYDRSLGSLTPRTIVDIGAHIGLFTLRAATRWPDARIYAFEPDPRNYETLMRNVAQNSVSNAVVHNLAVGGQSGQAEFYVGRQPETHSLYRGPFDESSERTICVDVLSMADIVNQIDSEVIDLLKIDCEGCEYEIVRAAGELLSRHVRYCVLEYHAGFGSAPSELVSALKRNGFSVSMVPATNTGMLYARNKNL